MKKTVIVVLAIAMILAIAPKSLRADATPDGGAIYKAKCQMCHGADAAKNTPDLAKMADADVAKTVSDGKAPKMPSYKTKLSADEITAVAKYIKSLKK